MASVTDLLALKRDGGQLSAEDLYGFASGIASGEVPPYQVSAFLMAAYIRGLSPGETTALTMAIRDSGSVMNWSPSLSPLADKHSTGGVGDKISIVLAPLAASMGIRVPMISGRSLGHTGGTLDKLSSIPGFCVDLSIDRFRRQIEEIGVCMIGQTPELAPADGVLYGLRDATATITSIPLICASILGKKLAENPDFIVFDVKCGSGAFMKTPEQAGTLARMLVETAVLAGKGASALVTSMNQPTGLSVGNALEVSEAIEVLEGRGPWDTREITLTFAAEMGRLAGLSSPSDKAREMLDSGAALKVFQRMTEAQGGDLDRFSAMEDAPVEVEVRASRSGFWKGPEALSLGEAVRGLGGGRYRVDDFVDPMVGWRQEVPCGTPVEAGCLLGVIHGADRPSAEHAAESIENAFQWDAPSDHLVLERIPG
ncbi:MAG: thymidine phosphorylase [Candidatus Fermentibacteraceae bacterium]